MTQWGLDTLFNPAKRHMDEEKRRLQSTRAEVGDNSGGKRIDLESGKVTIQKRDDEDDSTPESGTPRSTDSRSTDPQSKGPQSSKPRAGRAHKSTGGQAKGEPSAAAIRAAERRGRKPR